MAVFGDIMINAAALGFDRPSLRRGRFQAAQLWKVTSLNGRYFPLAEMLAPYIGDVEAVVPYQLVQVYRHLDAFRLPAHGADQGSFLVPVWPEEVRGMPVRYAVNVENGNDQRYGRMMARATRRGYIDVAVEARAENLFVTAWMRRFRTMWPMVHTRTGLQVHPALQGLVEQTALVHLEIRNRNVAQRGRWLERRRRMAAEMGLRVDRRGRVRNADDSSDDEL